MTPPVLVAGVGNVFLGDDAFGVEVVATLSTADVSGTFAQEVRVADYGTSGMHLAFDLLDGYELLCLVDATPRGERPGTLTVLDLGDGSAIGPASRTASVDAHGMQPDAVLRLLSELGGQVGRVLVVGCEPSDVDHRTGLSEPVRAAVPEAVRTITRLVADESFRTPATREEV